MKTRFLRMGRFDESRSISCTNTGNSTGNSTLRQFGDGNYMSVDLGYGESPTMHCVSNSQH